MDKEVHIPRKFGHGGVRPGAGPKQLNVIGESGMKVRFTEAERQQLKANLTANVRAKSLMLLNLARPITAASVVPDDYILHGVNLEGMSVEVTGLRSGELEALATASEIKVNGKVYVLVEKLS